jgi:hypothetical protein
MNSKNISKSEIANKKTKFYGGWIKRAIICLFFAYFFRSNVEIMQIFSILLSVYGIGGIIIFSTGIFYHLLSNEKHRIREIILIFFLGWCPLYTMFRYYRKKKKLVLEKKETNKKEKKNAIILTGIITPIVILIAIFLWGFIFFSFNVVPSVINLDPESIDLECNDYCSSNSLAASYKVEYSSPEKGFFCECFDEAKNIVDEKIIYTK